VPFTIAEAGLSAMGGFMFSAMAGTPLNNAVLATFRDLGGPVTTADYSATINFGDTTTATGTITGPDINNLFTVLGSHTFTTGGPFTITVTIRHETAPALTVTDTVNSTGMPGPGPGPGPGGVTLNGFETVPLTNVVVAFFTGGTAGQCTATIFWGDLTTSTGTVVGPDTNGIFAVVGSHTYIEDGEVEVDLIDTFPVTTTINCPGMAPTVVTATANITEEPILPAAGPPIVGMETVPITAVTAAFTGVP